MSVWFSPLYLSICFFPFLSVRLFLSLSFLSVHFSSSFFVCFSPSLTVCLFVESVILCLSTVCRRLWGRILKHSTRIHTAWQAKLETVKRPVSLTRIDQGEQQQFACKLPRFTKGWHKNFKKEEYLARKRFFCMKDEAKIKRKPLFEHWFYCLIFLSLSWKRVLRNDNLMGQSNQEKGSLSISHTPHGFSLLILLALTERNGTVALMLQWNCCSNNLTNNNKIYYVHYIYVHIIITAAIKSATFFITIKSRTKTQFW